MYKSPFVQRQSPEHKFSSGFDEKPSINLKAFRRRFRIPYKQIIKMENSVSKGAGKDDAPGQNKVYLIFINTREKEWTKKSITFDEVVVLAFGSISNDPNIVYTVTYKKGDNNKPEGIMVKGDEIKVKNEMRFNVTQTNRS